MRDAVAGGGHQGQGARSKLMEKFPRNPGCYPGKQDEDARTRGTTRSYTPQKQQPVANAAMAVKRNGLGPRFEGPRACENIITLMGKRLASQLPVVGNNI